MTRQMFLWRFLSVAIPAVLIVLGLHIGDRMTTLQQWQQHMDAHVNKSVSELTGTFHEAATDALMLSDDRTVRQSSLDAMSERFVSLARFHPHYQQIRFIDADGMERLRVNSRDGKIWRTTPNELQDKSARDYFQDAVDLPSGSLRLSRLDLNIEHGQIERPLNPMLRFSAPVISHSGKHLGVIVINYGVGRVLSSMFDKLDESGMRAMLLNESGAWLGGGEEADRWGSLLGRERTFKSMLPQVWDRLIAQNDDSVMQWSSDDLYGAAARIEPMKFLRPESFGSAPDAKISSTEHFWIVGSQIDEATLFAPVYERLQVALVLLTLGLSLWAFVMRGWGRLKILSMEALQQVQKLAKVVEQTSDHVLITDKRGLADYVNPAFCHATGYGHHEVIGENLRILKSGQHSEGFYRDMWSRITRGETFQDLFINRRKDGSLYYEEKTISPLLDDAGKATHFVSTGKDITESKITKMAFYDALTGLANRVLFLDRLQHEMSHARRAKQLIAVMYLDLDGFKNVNDDLGHEAGDKLLADFAKRISTLMRRSDTFARLGGDEFAILLKEIKDPADAEDVAQKILQEMQKPWRVEGVHVNLGVSIGISLYPFDEVDSKGLLKQADQAMYQAKKGGRNRFAVYFEGEESGSPV
jgi:diguanylate cyclase (GGDEF)-like protein/PAS domain S-box-containing protein